MADQGKPPRPPLPLTAQLPFPQTVQLPATTNILPTSTQLPTNPQLPTTTQPASQQQQQRLSPILEMNDDSDSDIDYNDPVPSTSQQSLQKGQKSSQGKQEKLENEEDDQEEALNHNEGQADQNDNEDFFFDVLSHSSSTSQNYQLIRYNYENI